MVWRCDVEVLAQGCWSVVSKSLFTSTVTRSYVGFLFIRDGFRLRGWRKRFVVDFDGSYRPTMPNFRNGNLYSTTKSGRAIDKQRLEVQ